jgi:hypothetical protein
MADYGHELELGTFILWSDEPGPIERFGREVAPALREAVARERGNAVTQARRDRAAA